MADMQNWKPAKFYRHKPGNPLMLRCNNIESTGCTTIHIHQGPIYIFFVYSEDGHDDAQVEKSLRIAVTALYS